VLNISVRH